jgi:copper(I)-binding protein
VTWGVERVIGAARLLSVCLLLVACGTGGDADPEVSNARVGQPAGPNAALYFTATGGDGADRLMGADTEAAAAVEMHETTQAEDGTMGMQAVDALDLPAGGSLVLEPGGFHLMLIGADGMNVGDTVEVILRWENAGEMSIEAEVVDPADTMSDGS